jgi:hypothetical protein
MLLADAFMRPCRSSSQHPQGFVLTTKAPLNVFWEFAVCDSARDSLDVNSCTHSNQGLAVMDGDPAVEAQLDGFSLVLPLPYRVALIIVLGTPCFRIAAGLL